jgi:hypothetical protein
VRLVSFVEAPELSGPVTGVTSSVTEVIEGAAGADLSSVKEVVPAVETLPATSV